MEWLETAGVLVAIFFLISLAVETILESFRGALSALGIEWLKSKQTLQEALNEVAMFLPAEQKDFARFQALVTKIAESPAKVADVMTKIDTIKQQIEKAVDPAARLAILDKEKEWLATASAPLKEVLEQREANRIFALRFISAVIGVAVAWMSHIDVIQIASGSDTAGNPLLAYLLAGLAAAGGSSFWHDQLDRLRAIKEIRQSIAS